MGIKVGTYFLYKQEHCMTHKTYLTLTGAIFLLIAVLHLLRAIYGWDAAIGGWVVPLWLSWVALVVAGYLGYQGIKFGKK